MNKLNKSDIKRFIKNNKIFLVVICTLVLASIGLMISTILINQNEIDKKNTYKKNIANYSRKNSSLEEINEELNEEAEVSAKRIDELQASFASLRQRLNKLILDSEKYTKKTEEDLKDIREIDLLKDATIRRLNDDLEKELQNLDDVEKQLAFFQTTLRERDSKILELQTKQNDIAKKALERNNEEWAKLQTPEAKEVQQLKRNIESIKKERDEYKKNAADTQKDYEEARGEVTDADQEAKDYKDEIDELRKDKAILKAKIAELEKKEEVNDDESRK